MTNFDLEPALEPAVSEPNSIAPMALDVNLWEIDLRNLRSGERLDLAVPAFIDELDQRADDLVLPPRGRAGGRTGRRVLGVMTAMAVVAGLGLAGFMARPSLQRALASSSSRVARTTALTAPAVPAAPVVAAPVVASPVVASPAAPVGLAAAAAVATTPTISAGALPDAPVAKKKGKRAPGKRAK